jgi:hypothetical protein
MSQFVVWENIGSDGRDEGVRAAEKGSTEESKMRGAKLGHGTSK